MQPNPVYVEAYAVEEPIKGISAVPAPAPSAPFNPSSALSVAVNEAGAREFLSGCRWPVGLQDTLVKNLSRIPYRIFICDDSGSMSASDGHRLIGDNPQNMKMIECSRWTELANSLSFHANLAYAANAPSEFRLLNGSAPIVIGNALDPDNQTKLDTFKALLENSPSGGTPLCFHIRETVEKIRSMETSLRQKGQKVCVVILTDGESSDGNLSTAMQALKSLPVWTVVRLCTDEEKIVEYWNNIDNELELDMDVLDDLCGEAQEVHEQNPWLCYGEPLHRLREFGIQAKEIDLLDEAKLTLDQVRIFASLLFGGRPDDYPHPDLSKTQFINCLEQQLRKTTNVWNPITKRASPWIITSRLPSRKGGNACVIC